MKFLLGIFFVILTIIAFMIAKWLYKRVYTPLLLPLTVATVLIIIFLLVFKIDFDTYMLGGDWISELLGPAVVALAYPLYQQRDRLKELLLPLVVGSFIGANVGILSGLLLTKWFGFSDVLIYSIAPKSVTTPVAVEITEDLGGIISLAAVFVMVAGVGGVIMSKYIFRIFGLDTPIGKGVGMGSASHGIGTAKALEGGELEGSLSSIAMILSAVFVSFLMPFMLALFM